MLPTDHDPAAAVDRTEKRYYIENQMMRMAAAGDSAGIHAVLAEAEKDFYFRRSRDELRTLKNLSFVFNTLLRKAIEFGGVHPVHIHKISERFAISIERAKSAEEIYELRSRMVDDYCALSRVRPGNGYGPTVSRCVEYIKLMYADRIDVGTLSMVAHVSKSYLCRIFKKETGNTIVDFINRCRIEEAKRLLLVHAGDLSHIALSVGFEDAKYFSRVFKKFEGMAPSLLRGQPPMPAPAALGADQAGAAASSPEVRSRT
jgi:two-component system response regulator YesN